MEPCLKEEFYRTGIVLAGKTPFWWLVPPGPAPRFTRAFGAIRRALFPSNQYVDLGGSRGSPWRALGAAIWQIVKGWNPPQVLAQMGLLEKARPVEEPGRPSAKS